MAIAIITLKIMPEDPDVDLDMVETEAKKKIAEFAGEGDTKTEIEPIAFGLKALKIIFVTDEKKGGTDNLEVEIGKIPGVNSVEVIDVRRAIG
jgi:elongation factor 1-beta